MGESKEEEEGKAEITNEADEERKSNMKKCIDPSQNSKRFMPRV